MTAEVSTNGSSYTLTLTDNSAPWTFSTVQTSSPATASSAEWIAEDPFKSTGSGFTKFADFGAVTFTGLSITYSGSYSKQLINMKNKAAAAMLSGSSFVVTWRHS